MKGSFTRRPLNATVATTRFAQIEVKPPSMLDFRQSLRRGENSLLLGAGKKKKGKRSLSYLVQSTFLSESRLAGR